MPRLEEFKPQMIFVSAGFDAHRDDDLGQLRLNENDFGWITGRISRRGAAPCQGPHRLDARRRLQPRRPGAQRRGSTCACSADLYARPMNFTDFTQKLSPRSRPAASGSSSPSLVGLRGGWPGAVSRWFGRDQPKDSIWFGERTFDGLLFPLLALVLTDLARRAADRSTSRCWCCASRCRCSCRWSVDPAVSRACCARCSRPPAMARLVERTISWLAWIGAVLWIVGLLPPVLAELDEITLAFGQARASSLRTIFERRVVGRPGAGDRAVDLADHREAHPARGGGRPVDAQGGVERDPRLPAADRPAVRAVGGGGGPDRAVGAGRRARRRPGLRPAEAGGQLRERLRDPARALDPHRRQRQASTASRAASPTSRPATRWCARATAASRSCRTNR